MCVCVKRLNRCKTCTDRTFFWVLQWSSNFVTRDVAGEWSRPSPKLQVFEQAIEAGVPVLLENMLEHIDAVLQPVPGLHIGGCYQHWG